MKTGKLNKDVVGQITEAIISNKKTKGKILAIARYVEDEKVCFQTAEGQNGTWIPALALVNYNKLVLSPSSVTSEEKTILVQSPLVESPQNVTILVQKRAEQDLTSLVNFADNLAKQLAKQIDNKVNSDIQLINSAIEETQKLVEDITKKINKSGKNTVKFIDQCLTELDVLLGSIVIEISNIIQNIWSEIFRQCVAWAMEETQKSFDRAKKVVDELKQKHPKEDYRQIAQRLINRSTVLSVTFGIAIDGIKLVESWAKVSIGLDLVKNSALLSELIYQISIAYGFDGDTKISTGEGIAIIALSLGIDVLQQLGLNALTSASLSASIAIKAFSNVALFQLVGYASCLYFELKQQKADNPLVFAPAYRQFTAKLQTYLNETLTETKKLNEIIKDAVEIKEEVPAFANA
ncbi:MAG: hypothetical protein IGQ45_13520 [Cyanobacterium sp. T60_A2020_053]|nr:hypothetical protein [Cyanobacterium sp. T60_A2020_053]